jgi:hypothetical protein
VYAQLPGSLVTVVWQVTNWSMIRSCFSFFGGLLSFGGENAT